MAERILELSQKPRLVRVDPRLAEVADLGPPCASWSLSRRTPRSEGAFQLVPRRSYPRAVRLTRLGASWASRPEPSAARGDAGSHRLERGLDALLVAAVVTENGAVTSEALGNPPAAEDADVIPFVPRQRRHCPSPVSRRSRRSAAATGRSQSYQRDGAVKGDRSCSRRAADPPERRPRAALGNCPSPPLVSHIPTRQPGSKVRRPAVAPPIRTTSTRVFSGVRLSSGELKSRISKPPMRSPFVLLAAHTAPLGHRASSTPPAPKRQVPHTDAPPLAG
jgi:hypothetical protein